MLGLGERLDIQKAQSQQLSIALNTHTRAGHFPIANSGIVMELDYADVFMRQKCYFACRGLIIPLILS
jgi:hypothetical protein